MKYDVIIIGGGLSGLTAGLTLVAAGKKTCIVSAGQNSLHFGSGSFDLLGYDQNGNVVSSPLDAMDALDATHPYKKIGKDQFESLAGKAKTLLEKAGIQVRGEASSNHYRLTPIGTLKPAWLTMSEYVTTDAAEKWPWNKADIVNIEGFLDFPTQFLAANLAKQGVVTAIKEVSTAALMRARKSPTEMRATNIAKVLASPGQLEEFAQRVNSLPSNADTLLLPAVLGFNEDKSIERFKAMLNRPVEFVATMPPCLSGVRATIFLKRAFCNAGGTFLTGDTVHEGFFEGARLTAVKTTQLPDELLEAQNFILATGSFFSHGLKSNYQRVFEPVFGLDVDADESREKWTRKNLFEAQPYMGYGVKTNAAFQASIGGNNIENLFATGSVLSGHHSVKLADAAGVSMLTALKVTENMIGR